MFSSKVKPLQRTGEVNLTEFVDVANALWSNQQRYTEDIEELLGDDAEDD